ncbi:uncharacterized protein LOC131884863 isoform X2 [Tigriopus californicus]|uniref:uncharacterized protein LOC131884863 isoform X2 n=1 Tax=Tigriopus californicus TaxID=6832 RepID=UPI0027DA679F|nr:uncharacterized protein LOC131884863 isoform X2 [Tigriopus californicus]
MTRAQLPPKLQGRVRGHLRVRFEAIQASDRPTRVDITWWGHAKAQRAHIGPDGKAWLDYDVITSHERFQQYLADAQKVLFEVRGGARGRISLGLALWESVAESLKCQEGISKTLDLFDTLSGQWTGKMRVGLQFGNRETLDETPLCTAMKASQPPSPVKSGPKYPSYQPTPKFHPRRNRKSPRKGATPTAVCQSSSSDSSSSPHSSPSKERPFETKAKVVEFVDNGGNPAESGPTGVSFSQDFTDDITGLRRILKRSRDRLERDKPDGNRRTGTEDSIKYTGDESSSSTASILSCRESPPGRPIVTRVTPPPPPNPPTPPTCGLPSWNLSTCRLHFLSTVTQLQVHIRGFQLTPNVLDKLQASCRPKCPARTSSKARAVQSDTNEILSFFVSYQVPQSPLPNQYCSRRMLGNGQVVFNQKSAHPTVFKPATLDVWWTSNMTFKIHSRALNQRVPTLIGEASIGLKHLLTEPHNSNGHWIKLPIFVSQTLAKNMKSSGEGLCSEIVGDLEVSFLLTRIQNSVPIPKPLQRPVSPQMAVRDGEKDFHSGSKSSNHLKQDGLQLGIKAVEPMPELSPTKPSVVQSGSRSFGPRNVFAYLRISEGRGFLLTEDYGQSVNSLNLFVSSHFLSSDDVVKSPVCWNTDRPQFSLSHYIPLSLDEKFLERCRENYLVVEVWNYSEPKNLLVGLSLLPLHQFHLGFQDPDRRSVLLGLDLPVIAVNDWIGVNSLTTGKEMGQLRATLAVGTETQIHKLKPLLGMTSDSIVVSEIKTSARRQFEDLSEHLYDTSDSGGQGTPNPIHDHHKPSPPSSGSTFADRIRIKESSMPDHEEVVNVMDNNESEAHVDDDNNEEDGDACHYHGANGEDECISPRQAAINDMEIGKEWNESGSHASFPPHFYGQILIEEARNLPRVFDPLQSDQRIFPSCYVSFVAKTGPTDNGQTHKVVVSNLIPFCRDPRWCFETKALLSADLLQDPKRQFILKVWHHPADLGPKLDPEADHVIGFVAVDLKPLLLSSFPIINGWYNIMDFVGRCRGQIFVSIKPLEDVCRMYRHLTHYSRRDSEELSSPPLTKNPKTQCYYVSAKYPSFPSHLVQHPEQLISPVPTTFDNPVNISNNKNNATTKKYDPTDLQRDTPESVSPENHSHYWYPPELPENMDQATHSLLELKLNDMDKATKLLKNKLSCGNPTSVNNLDNGVQPTKSSNSSDALTQLSLQELQHNISTQLRELSQQTLATSLPPRETNEFGEVDKDVDSREERLVFAKLPKTPTSEHASAPKKAASVQVQLPGNPPCREEMGPRRMVSFSEENIQSTRSSNRQLYRSQNDSTVSEGETEIIELLEDHLADEEGSVDLEPFLLPYARQNTLEELEQIDWAQFLSPESDLENKGPRVQEIP